MVELSDPKGPYQEGISNSIFIIPGVIVVVLVGTLAIAWVSNSGSSYDWLHCFCNFRFEGRLSDWIIILSLMLHHMLWIQVKYYNKFWSNQEVY